MAPKLVGTSFTRRGLPAWIAASAPARAAASSWSTLLRRTRSAQPSWSPNSSSSGLSWSSAGSAARCAATARGSSAKRPAAAAGPSTTAMTPSTVTRVRTSGQLKAFTSGFGSARPEVSMTMWSGGSGRFEQLLDGRQEVVGHGAADAAVGELDDVVLRAGRDAAARQELAVDAELAELVDDEREAAAVGVAQQMPDHGGLAGAEEAGDDGGGDLGGHRSSFFRSRGRPAAMK